MERRLIKVATELNVGLHTIVDFLNGKGFDIEDKPTAKVTDAMYTELQKEYQKSVDIKEKADSLVIGNRPGQVTVPPVVKRDTPPAPAVKADAPAQPEEAPKEEPREEKPSPPKLKVVGKINLEERLKNRMRGGEANEPAQPATESKPEPASPPSPAPVEMPEPKPAEIQASPKPAEITKAAPEPVEVPAPAPEPVKVAEPTAVLKEPSAQAKPVIVEQSPKPAPKPVSPPAPQPVTETSPAAPEDDVYRAEAPELRGLKILGKIELDKHSSRGRGGKKEKEKEKPKPAQTPAEGNKTAAAPQTDSAADADNKRKRKRKRKKISGEENNSPNARPAPQGGGDRPQQAGQQGRQHSRPPAGPPNQQQPRGQQPPRRMEPAPPASQEVSQREIEEKIKATMARLSGGGKKKRQKLRRDNRERLRGRQEERDAEMMTDKLQVTEFISVQELANMMGVPAVEVIMTCMNLGVIVSINQRLDAEVIELVASEFGYEVEFISVEEQLEDELEVKDDPEDLQPRAPIVTVMGHVDHGKTSLLDYIRSANVVSGEAGGITQHIGAYEVEVGPSKKKITFLDTPGHEAFTAMRARGAKITDIAVIIVAADDSVMPQTREAISHATAAGVPIVFAINKIDKPGANPEKIKQDLAAMNYLVESWGGKYQSQDISAKTGEGIEELLEKILLEAEMLDLKANPDRIATGTVIEASLDKGRGYVTKLLVQSGTLKDGHVIVAGEYSGRVKAMFNERNKRIKAAGPSAPVLVLGLSGAPQAGERFKVTETDQEARQLAMKRAQISREQANRATKRISLEEIGRRLALGNFKELNIIVKGDVDGSIEALSDALIKLSIESVQVNTIHKAVGQITESDVLLASASDAIIVGFQVRPSANARKLAEREGVEIKLYSIIYEAIEQVKAAIEGMLEPTREETIVAQVQVRDVFKISKVGIVAGCYVEEGKIARSTHIRLIRDGIVIFPTREGANGEIESLKRFKDDVREVRAGMECGITIKNCNDIQVGDVIEGYEITMTKQKLN